ncbi:Disease resistance protein [Melia azedarach]|uniref:Disease resistance protein n=1 Tax=Melia azedarach TaxID=155640 RepID=A0ACC1Y833_MELAZ|nr:Disease resistance protein [Melia azedarach]
MSAGEIVAIVTGVLGCVTAILTPLVRSVFEQSTKYIKLDEDVSKYLEEEKQNLLNMIEILREREGTREVPDRARLSGEAWEIVGMIGNCQDIETWDCFGFCWCLADYRKSYLVGKYVSDIKRRVNKLREELESRGVHGINALEEIERKYYRSRTLVGEQAREVSEKIKTEAWKFKSGIIGIFGACGVGKTHVVRYAYESLQIQKDLFTLIWLNVSNRVDLIGLQLDIANQIDLELPNFVSFKDNVKKFKKALRKKFILLVLDDMRKTISLEELGLPIHNILIVITSRSFAVCSEMQCDDKIALKSLSDDEAYELLKIEIGTRFLSTDKIQFTLKKIIKECGCLPLAIIAAAKSLRKYFEYHDVFLTERSLKMESAKFSNLKYIKNKVIQDLKLSYEQLESSRYSCAKKCLLYCATYPRSHAFAATELMNNWMAEGLLREVEDIDEKLGEAKEILEELKDASLLKSTAYEDGEEIVKMHPIVWDMAVELEKEDPPPEELTSRSEMVIATSDMASSSS